MLFAIRTELKSATAEKQCDQENQTAGIYAKAEILHFSTAAAQEQDDEQDPCAVAAATETTAATAVTTVVAVAFTATVIEHSVDHIYLHFAEVVGSRI